MIKRRKTTTVKLGPLRMGSRSKILIQTMTKVFTTNVDACVRQIDKLQDAGCDLVRLHIAIISWVPIGYKFRMRLNK